MLVEKKYNAKQVPAEETASLYWRWSDKQRKNCKIREQTNEKRKKGNSTTLGYKKLWNKIGGRIWKLWTNTV